MLTIFLAAAVSVGSVPAPTDAQSAAAVEAERVGHLLYDFDQAAWVSSDALLAALGDPGKAGVRGWIIETEGADQVAVYYGLRGRVPYKIFVGRVHDGRTVSSGRLRPGEDDVMTPVERRMVDARAAVLNPDAMTTAKVQICGAGSFNTVVLPPVQPDGLVSVYVLSPQATMETLPFGGHYRFQVDARNKVVESRPFAKSCTDLKKPAASSGARPEMIFITHLLDDQPTEIHVWQSLVAKVPVYVGVIPKMQIWAADGQQVRMVGTIPVPPKPGT